MHKPTFSFDCASEDAADNLDLPSSELLEVEGFHLLASMGGQTIVCVHDTNGGTRAYGMPEAARECLPGDADLANHFERLLRAQHN